MKIEKIVIKGQKQVNTAFSTGDEDWSLQSSYLIGGTTRGSIQNHEEDLKDNTIVELIFEDDTVWICDNTTVAELFPEALPSKRAAITAFELPSSISSPVEERGLFSNIALKIVNIFTKKAVEKGVKKLLKKEIDIAINNAAGNFEKKKLNSPTGLFRLDSDFKLHERGNLETDKPFLLFLHGTASSTHGSFDSLKGSSLWQYICNTYGDNILAYQHFSLTQSPLENAVELAKLLPDNITLHIVSHSRGGLIGDILCRYTNKDNDKKGFSKEEKDALKKPDSGNERSDDLEQIESLDKTFGNKNLFITKYVRVACPAAGTTLASKRMDIYFNIIANLAGFITGGSANPLFIAFRQLMSAIIESKNDTGALPGIEAMDPDSPFIKALNNPFSPTTSDSPLAVISGNSSVHFNKKALKVIASKLFFLADNDLVVNTDSMYLGTKRSGLSQFYFDQEDTIDHFHYFNTENAQKAIRSALELPAGSRLPLFQDIVRPTTGVVSRALLEHGELDGDNVTGRRPIVILLPGIMGSNIGTKSDLLWINYEKFIGGGLTDLNNPTLTATSLIKTSYAQLKKFLSQWYDVATFPFDWRLSLRVSAGLFEKKIVELMSHNQPIKIIAHSMGGVLVRDFMALYYKGTWDRLKNTAAFQLIFLGAPLGGSFRIPAVLFGMDSIIKKLAFIDIHHNKKELLEVFCKMEGLLSLLPNGKDEVYDFGDPDTWKRLQQASGDDEWPIPPISAINNFKKYRDDIRNQELDTTDYKNAVYIAGKAKSTPFGCLIEENASTRELVFVSTGEGDESVTWDSGIPKLMQDAGSVYYVDVTHGSLANAPAIFDGILDILRQGRTDKLSKKRPLVRAAERTFRAMPAFDFDLSPAGVERTLLGLQPQNVLSVNIDPPISLSISNGDLRYSSYPLLAGHFEDDGLLYAEKDIDLLLDNELSRRHLLRLYPGSTGTSEVVFCKEDNFKGAVIAGLGKPGTLNPYLLATTVEQAVCKYLLEINAKGFNIEKVDANGKTGLSTLIIGCGYGGLSVEESIKAIIQGAQAANASIRKLFGPNYHCIETIEFIEKNEDRALACLYSLSRVALDSEKSFNVTLPVKKIQSLLGSTKKIPHEATEEWWNRITVRSEQDQSTNFRVFKFNRTTGGAREDERKVYSSPNIVDNLIDNISNERNWSPALAKTIFELVIPNDFKDELRKQCSINWILDEMAAAYPWEMLQDIVASTKPFAINAGMIRQLSIKDARPIIKDVTKNSALVIAVPNLNGTAPELPAAKQEGQLARETFTTNGFEVTSSIEGSAPEIIVALFKDDYRVIHLSGHGTFDPENPDASGMLIGEKIFLSTKEIEQMSTTPELVFINCCYLGKINGAYEDLYKGRYKLAANLGTQLIKNGVKAVIACGWAVDDAAALAFAKIFYEHMFAGDSFGKAVLEARRHIYNNFPQSNTWGAYQCYGDPFYRLKIRKEEKRQTAPNFVIAQEAEYALYNLLNELEMGKMTPQEYLDRLKMVSEAVDRTEIRNAAITEKEALIYAELGDYSSALAKFQDLLRVEKANFSFSSLEKYTNIRAKKIAQDYISEKDPIKKAGKNARQAINHVISDINVLITAGTTAERLSLLGAGYKRLAIVTPKAHPTEKAQAYTDAAKAYHKAYTLSNAGQQVYTLTNWLTLEFILIRSGKRKWGEKIEDKYDLPSCDEARVIIDTEKKKITNINSDYWAMVAYTNLELCALLLDENSCRELKKWKAQAQRYMDLWKKAGSPGKKLAEIEHLQFLSDALGLKSVNIDETTADLFTHLSAYLESVRTSLENTGDIQVPKPEPDQNEDPKLKKIPPAKKIAAKKKAAKKRGGKQ